MENQEKKFTKIIEEGKESLVDIEDQTSDQLKKLNEKLEEVRKKILSKISTLDYLRMSNDPRDKLMEKNEIFYFQELTKREEELEGLIKGNMLKMKSLIKKPYED